MREFTILYGSQTGTAQEVAEQIGRNSLRYHLNVKVQALDDYDIVQLVSESMVVFVVATTGQGDPPSNMKKFWRFIWRKNLPPDSLLNVRYAVLGLGDSSYQKFNFIAKKLNKRLAMLGGEAFVDIGLGDDQHEFGYHAVVDEWMKSMLNIVLQQYPLPPGVSIVPETALMPPKYKLSIVGNETGSTIDVNGSEEIRSRLMTTPASSTNPFCAELVGNERVTATDHWQDVRLLTFDLTGSGIVNSPGDILHVCPENSPHSVDDFISLLGLDPSATCSIETGGSVKLQLPQPCTVRDLVARHLDINCIPKRYFWELMSKFTDSDLEREKLTEFCSSAGQEELYSYCNRPRRTILEVLHDFPGATRNIPFSYLFDMTGQLRPRAFSIASAQQVGKDQLQLLVAVVKYKTKLFAPRFGVCSTYLARLDPSAGTRVPVWVEEGSMQFPKAAQTPVIMVGPGTGCAPFRSFIQQRAAQLISGNYLYFGCRNKDKDFFCRDEWLQFESLTLLKLFVAFSRDQEHKIYVQHLISQQQQVLWQLIDKEQAWIFIAGNSKNMPESVRDALKTIISKYGNKTDEEAECYLNELGRVKRYQLETWS